MQHLTFAAPEQSDYFCLPVHSRIKTKQVAEQNVLIHTLVIHNVSSHSCSAPPLWSQRCSHREKSFQSLNGRLVAYNLRCVQRLHDRQAVPIGHIQLPSRCDQITSVCVRLCEHIWEWAVRCTNKVII